MKKLILLTLLIVLAMMCSAHAQGPDEAGPPLAKPLSEVPVKVVDRPDFRRTPVGKVARPSDVTVRVVSEKRNKITDVDAWFETHRVTSRCSQAEEIFAPKEFQGKALTCAIRSDGRLLLIYDGTVLFARSLDGKEYEYALDFSNYVHVPKAAEPDGEFVIQDLTWARQIGSVLYVSYAHSTYAKSSFGMNAYVSAIDLRSMRAIWHSAPLVSNAKNFEVLGDYLVTGYGFTKEPDFLFLIRRDTGEAVARIPVRSSPEHIFLKNDRLYVRTYDTDYVFQIVRRTGPSHKHE